MVIAKSILKATLLLLALNVSLAHATGSYPQSTRQNNVETFQLDCPGKPKSTTIDMEQCLGEKDGQVIAVQKKYETAARKRLEDDLANPQYHALRYHNQLQRTLDAYNAENQAWDALRGIASKASFTNYEDGTLREAMSINRDIEIRELRIHDVWQNWLVFMDSTPAVLPEPKFINVN